MSQQLKAVTTVLRTVLREMGYREFEVEPGETFDPTRMECVGYADGAPGVVINVIRSGFSAGDAIVRCAGVTIADPSRSRHAGDRGMPGDAARVPPCDENSTETPEEGD
jgi:molecular chaperone GrpE (heat shock protein)